MVRTYKRKTEEVPIEQMETIRQRVEAGEKIRAVARSLNMSEATIRRKLKKLPVATQTTSYKMSIPEESEFELAVCIKMMAKWGFSPTREELKDLVKDYVKSNKETNTSVGHHLRKYCQFKDDRPGEDWLANFLKRNNLSTKKPASLEKARKSAASDPEVIYSMYDLLEQEIKRLGLEDRPECIWNADETNLGIDPVQTKVIAPRGEKASRITATSGRELYTVMGAANAVGDYLPPLIVFKGSYHMAAWKAPNSIPGTQIAVSPKGWMTTSLFEEWFSRFCKRVVQRPILMVFDGHSSHLSYKLVKEARDEGITILKLPSHTTDRLQPLDLTVYKPLKTIWDKKIAEYNSQNLATKISKSEFIELVGNTWPEVFSKSNILAGFRKSGIYPLDRSKYAEENFNPNLLALYKEMHDPKIKSVPSPHKNPDEPAVSTSQVSPGPSQPPIFLSSPQTPRCSTPVPGTSPPSLKSYTSDASSEEMKSFVSLLSSSIEKKKKAVQEKTEKKPSFKLRLHGKSQILSTQEIEDMALQAEKEKQAKEGGKRKKNAKEVPVKKTKKATESFTPQSSPEPTPPSSPICNDSSELSDEGSFPESVVFFESRKYVAGIAPKVGNYYAVDYGTPSAYIGRVESINENNTLVMKFLRRYPDDRYSWPNNANMENDVEVSQCFARVNIKGTLPFVIRGVFTALKKFQRFRRIKKSS